MKKYTTAKKQTDRKLNALQNKIKDLRIKGDKLTERHSMLLKRQKDLAHQHGESRVKGSDMIELNVGGKKMRALRETLTLVKGSRLEVLFGGRWESKLLRDEEGCVFFDLNPRFFKKILGYLYLVKVHGSSKEKKLPRLPKFTDAQEQKILGLYMNFFRLQGSKEDEPIVPATVRNSSNDSNSEDDEDNTSYEGLLSTFKEEEKEMTHVEKNLDKIEEKLEAEEDFVSFFTDEDQSFEYDSDGSISFASMGSNMSSIFDRGSSSSSKGDSNNKTTAKSSILKLWIDDEIVPVKRSTLCLCKDSQLAEDFGSSDWVDKHSFKCDDGTQVILIEYPPSYFKLIIDRLRLRAMMLTSGGELPRVKMNNTKEMRGLGLKDLVSVLFEGKEDFILGDKPIINMDSKIVTSASEVDQI